MTEIAKIELVAFNIGIKIPFSGCDQNLILRIYSFALWFLQKLQSFLFTGSEENMKCFASNSSGNTRLICQDISFLAPTSRLQTMVRLKSFSQRREREGGRKGGEGFIACWLSSLMSVGGVMISSHHVILCKLFLHQQRQCGSKT